VSYDPPTVITSATQFTIAGRPVILRGINQEAGGTDSITTKLGAKFVRIRVPWAAVEPREGVWSQPVLRSLDRQVRTYGREGVQVLLDFHTTNETPPPAWSGYFDHPYWFGWTHSIWVYLPFVKMMVTRYQRYPNVMGWEIWNEPHSQPNSAQGTTEVIRWENFFVKQIRQLDPDRAIVVQLRGGWDQGLTHAQLSYFTDINHLVLDFHENWSGTEPGSGFSASGELLTAVCKATWSCSIPYHGTLASQKLHLSFPLQWRTRLNRPVLIGEWDGLTAADPNVLTLQSQVLAAFAHYGLSWARWQGGDQNLFGDLPDGLNPAGEQIKNAIG
jgi:hypothetical protein